MMTLEKHTDTDTLAHRLTGSADEALRPRFSPSERVSLLARARELGFRVKGASPFAGNTCPPVCRNELTYSLCEARGVRVDSLPDCLTAAAIAVAAHLDFARRVEAARLTGCDMDTQRQLEVCLTGHARTWFELARVNAPDLVAPRVSRKPSHPDGLDGYYWSSNDKRGGKILAGPFGLLRLARETGAAHESETGIPFQLAERLGGNYFDLITGAEV